ncbi:MAG: pilin [Candidatus Falkowbacteria bacterium]|nr:pilin [Candidatus Falkowbacteria bacterium]
MILSSLKKTVLLFGLFFCLASNPSFALAQVDTSYGLNTTMDQGNLKQALSATDPRLRAGQIIGVVLSFIGVIFLILMIYAGIMWMTAAGNEQQVSKAKDLLVNAIIGLVIVFAAYAITAYIGDLLTNTSTP